MADILKPDVRLEVGGSLYGGWTSISITRGLDQVAGTFSLSYTERWPQDGRITRTYPVNEGDPCRVLIDGIPVITGYVDDAERQHEATSYSLSVSGRDKTGDILL